MTGNEQAAAGTRTLAPGAGILKAGERIDDLQRNGYGIIQNGSKFCFGMDAVLLSAFAVVRKGETVVDLGTGTGVIPLLLEAKTEGGHYYGIEIQPDMADMARRSVALNGLEARIDIITGDIRELALTDGRTAGQEQAGCNGAGQEPEGSDHIGIGQEQAGYGNNETGTEIKSRGLDVAGGLGRLAGSIDVVTANPPYMKELHGLQNPDDSKAVARHEVKCSLQDVCRAAARLLQTGGRLYMVHRPLRLPEIITELKAEGLEPKRMRPVYPFTDREANMILIEAVKGGRPECRLERPLIVYDSPGVYTDEVRRLYG